MSRKNIDLSGHKFGSLTVIKFSHKDKYNKSVWLCRCDCGQSIFVAYRNLILRNSTKCGCLYGIDKRGRRNPLCKHGMSGYQEYKIWKGMRTRCNNKNSENYKNYGGRGISVCARWEKFENFYKDIGERPSIKHSIDRINVNSGYEPNNCRWATAKEQAQNSRRNISILN